MKLKLKNSNGTYSITDDSVRDVQINLINTNLVAMQNVLGTKNLFPISLQSQTVDGEITVTVNATDKSITLNGTASTVKVINFPSTFMLPAAKLDILQFGGSTACFVQVAYNDAPAWWNGASETHHLFELIEPKEMSAQLIIGPNTYNNETIKVMIVPQGTDPTYAPYAMTNRELTERVLKPSYSNEVLLGTMSNTDNSIVVTATVTGWIIVSAPLSGIGDRTIKGYITDPSDKFGTGLYSFIPNYNGGPVGCLPCFTGHSYKIVAYGHDSVGLEIYQYKLS